MTIYCDWQIRALCEAGMIQPFREELLNPASLDVTLGETIMLESAARLELVQMSIAGCTPEDPYELRPGQFILAETEQLFMMPAHVSAQFLLKSSRAREGLQHLLAGWIDPGFSGSRLTLELKNIRQLHPIALWPGMRIGQLVFHRMDDRPGQDYSVTGRYNGCLSVTGSRGHD